ncbi:AAA family ATPase [Paenibacillus solani]|uniref:AAA+ ATPase domain-containing protein n=1 Tax=Paenibacillus solani TaxID=1705565 RepID=A0A0M1P7L4_9BACL|nr:AAA family ATPase [Paenibacillus solani]KOR90377.1 hypothetical protein AM231_15430 [Paenibacillus solani]
MKLSKINVSNLFGVFTHEVKINTERGITIVIGENGLGKTVLLEMIESFFNKRFHYFCNVNFEELFFEFDDGVEWIIKKISNAEEEERLLLKQVNGELINEYSLQISNDDSESLIRFAQQIARSLGMRRISITRWEDRRDRSIYSTRELIEKYGDSFSSSKFRYENEAMIDAPEWFIARFEKISVTLIETQRVFIVDEPDQAPVETVKKYSSELSQLMKRKLTESTELSSKLDRTYPNRLVNELKQKKAKITDEVLNEKLKELEEKRTLLDQVGLIETEKDSILLKIDKPQDVVKDVLMLYIKDSFEKLSIFDLISIKIELLLKIINDRFKHKKLFVDKENSFLFRSTVIKDEYGGFQIIPIEKLSSGEKNELILFYKLIFKTSSNSLILIDEPEISLHISWQNKFISDLHEIHKLNELNILIATHSPDIISNNWDLKVELKGVE